MPGTVKELERTGPPSNAGGPKNALLGRAYGSSEYGWAKDVTDPRGSERTLALKSPIETGDRGVLDAGRPKEKV